MKILKKRGWGGNEIHAPCACGFDKPCDRTYDIPNFSHTVISDRAILTIKLFGLWYISNYSVFFSFNMSLEEFVLDFCTVRKLWKRKDYGNVEKRGGVVEKRGGEEETKSMPRAPVVKTKRIQLVLGVSSKYKFSVHESWHYIVFALYIVHLFQFCNIHVNLFNRGIFVNTKMYIV
jgi:hypothetical protein